MKQQKRLKRWMKDLLAEKGLNPDNWYYIKNIPDELVIIHKYSLKPRIINLSERGA